MIKALAIQIDGATIREGDHLAKIPGAGIIQVKSADRPDSLRGEGLDFCVLDECAFMREEAWSEALRPALSDRQGGAMFISTPKGRNWFWRLYQRGQDEHEPDWASWQRPTSENPFIPAQEIADAKRDLPERIFEQEYLAEFKDDAGGVFRRVMDAATAQEQGPIEGHQYIAGVDVAAMSDFTVISVMDVAAKRMVYLDRFSRVEYETLEDRLAALHERYRLSSMIVEANSIGQPVIDHLVARGIPARPFTTTNVTKHEIITALQSAFEHGEITILSDKVLIAELQAFEMERLKSGLVRYGAPQGMHDDCVMSLALAWQAVARPRFILA